MTITLDEDGQMIEKSLEPYDMEIQMMGKTFDSSGLMFFGRIYEVECLMCTGRRKYEYYLHVMGDTAYVFPHDVTPAE